MAHPIKAIEEYLHANSASLIRRLPTHINVDVFIDAAVRHIAAPRKGPKLWDPEEVNRNSLFAAVGQAAADGMMLDGIEAALTVFSGNAQYMQMIGGIMRKLHNTGRCKSITVEVVYDGEPYVYTKGEDEALHHTPLPPSQRASETEIAAYAVVKLDGGEVYREWMWAEELAEIESTSRSKFLYQGPWRSEMLKKAPLRRLAKRLPLSTEDKRQAFRTLDAEYQLADIGEPGALPEPTPQLPVPADPEPEAGQDRPAKVPEEPVPAPQPDGRLEAPVSGPAQGSPRRTRAAEKIAQARSSEAPQAESAPSQDDGGDPFGSMDDEYGAGLL